MNQTVKLAIGLVLIAVGAVMATAPPLGITCWPPGSPYNPYPYSEYCETTVWNGSTATVTATVNGVPTTYTTVVSLTYTVVQTTTTTVINDKTTTIITTVTTELPVGGKTFEMMLIPLALIGTGGIVLIYSRKRGSGG